jgi:Glycosyltransferase family 87
MAASQSETRSSHRLSVLVLIASLALAGGASMLYYHFSYFMPRALEAQAAKGLGKGYSFGGDFYPIWLTTRQSRVGHPNIYGPEMTRQIQTGLFGRPLGPHNASDPPADYRSFAYPATADLVLWPFSTLDFSRTRVVLAVLLPLLTAASVWFWVLAMQWRISPIWLAVVVILTLCSYQGLEALFAEQPGLIVGFLLACSALALRKDRLMLAGALIALTLIKPQMTLLATVYLLVWSMYERRFKLCVGFLVITLPLIGASLWIWPNWIGQWMQVLFGYHRYSTPSLVTLLPGPTLGAYIGPLAIAVMLAVSAGLMWRYRRASPYSVEFWLTLSLLLAITAVAILPGQAVYDHVILLPGIFLIVRYRYGIRHAGRVPRILLAVGAVALIWPWVTAFGLIVVHAWMTPAHFNSSVVLALPIRTAASLPFAVLALLSCTMRINLPGDQQSS